MSKFFEKQLKTFLYLAGSFCFAFLLGEMIHEVGHLLAHRYFGTTGVSIHLDPFGGSLIFGVQALPLHQMGITAGAGPALNLVGGVLCSRLLRKRRRPGLVPLALWGPVALTQEGVNLSMGLFSPGSDAQWLVRWGLPGPALATLGVVLIIAGTAALSWILSVTVMGREGGFWERFGMVFLGLGFLIFLRGAAALLRSPAGAAENLVPLAFVLPLALVISWLIGLLRKRRAESSQSFGELSWEMSLLTVFLGLGILLLEVVLP